MNTENGNGKQALQNKIKVKHDFNEVAEGVEYIMTLKDQNVLETNEDDLDVLENEILNQNKNLKLSEKRALEKEQDQYLKDQILSKYDNDDSKIKGFVIAHENKKAKIKNSEINLALELDENQISSGDNFNNNKFNKEELQAIKDKLNGLRSAGSAAVGKRSDKDKELVQLSVETKFTTDYLTPEEFKPKEFKKKNYGFGKNKKIKLSEASDKEGFEGGFRESAAGNEEEKKVKIISNEFYKSAEDEYDELNKFLERQRNLVNKNKILEAPEEKIKNLLLNTNVNHNAEESMDSVKDFDSIRVKEEVNKENKPMGVPIAKKNKLEEILISETSEFLKQIPSKKDREDEIKTITSINKTSLKDVKSGTASVAYIPLPSERIRYGLSSVISHVSENEKFLNRKREQTKITSEKEELKTDFKKNKHYEADDSTTGVIGSVAESDDDRVASEIPELAEPLVGKGLAVALKVLQSRGLVGKEALYGRYKDTGIDRVERIEKEKAAKSEVVANKPSTQNFNIDLEYRDEKGRELTKKEAYRNLCYSFHNKLPSYKKIEKKIKRDEMQQKLMNKDVAVEGITNKYLKNQQMTKDVSYVVLQGKNNNL